MSELPPIIFWILIAMVFIWFGLIITLFRRLKIKHSEKYKEMGQPSLFWNNSMKSGWSTLKFLCKREHQILGDPTLAFLSDSMLVFFAVYLVLFFGPHFLVRYFNCRQTLTKRCTRPLHTVFNRVLKFLNCTKINLAPNCSKRLVSLSRYASKENI